VCVCVLCHVACELVCGVVCGGRLGGMSSVGLAYCNVKRSVLCGYHLHVDVQFREFLIHHVQQPHCVLTSLSDGDGEIPEGRALVL
jgi:hypothetical protein